MARLNLTLLATLLLLGNVGPHAVRWLPTSPCLEASQGEHHDPDLQEEILNAALERDRTRITEILAAEAPTPIRRLAKVVLEEWELDTEEPTLQQPRLVWYPHPTPDDLAASNRHSRYSTILVDGIVCPNGTFLEPTLLESTGNQELDSLILDAARQAVFRPAQKHGKYTQHRSRIAFHWPL